MINKKMKMMRIARNNLRTKSNLFQFKIINNKKIRRKVVIY